MAKKSKSDSTTIFLRNAIIFCFFIFLLVLMIRYWSESIQQSKLFVVKEVTVEDGLQFLQSRIQKQLYGRNIFSIDLKRVHQELRTLYPQMYDVRVERKFPNTIHIAAKKRDAFAQILVNQNYLTVDSSGVVIFVDKKPSTALPLVRSQKLTKHKIFLGSRLDLMEVLVALETIQVFKGNSNLNKYPISNVNSDNLSKVTFDIGPQLHIILDQENIVQKLNTLATLFAQKKLNFLEIQYIDLRFKEPIVGKKGN